MGLVQTLEDKLLAAIKNFFAPVVTPLTRLWEIIKGFFTALIDIVPETIALVRSIISEVNEWRDFKQGIKFNRGVINLQSVKDGIEDLVTEIVTAWHSLVDLFTSGFKMPLRSIEEAQQAAEEVITAFEDFGGKFGLREFLAKLGTKLEKAGGKVFEVLALIQAVAEEALKVVRELQSIVDAVRDVRELFQTGKGLFLKQNNPRRTIKLEDGSTIKIRVGNLHS